MRPERWDRWLSWSGSRFVLIDGDAALKAKIALEALREQATVSDLASAIKFTRTRNGSASDFVLTEGKPSAVVHIT